MEIGSCRESIAAIATPAGRGGIGIIRISGSRIESFCTAILGCIPKPRVATYLPFLDAQGSAIDAGIAVYFPGPASFTGEDILELQAHGGRIILDLLLARTVELGARIARPGEFSERAFLNEKIDLIQAEAVADLIEANTVQAARSARRAMEGAFSIRVNKLVEELQELRVYVEAAIDFSEEEIEFLSDGSLCNRLFDLERKVQTVLSTARQGFLFRDGITLVIAGKPNSGKSSLLNVLTKRDTAIVTSHPGTTRDVLRETIQIDGIPVHVIDTAGLRHSEDLVEQEGIRRAREEIKQADRILWMIDASNPDHEQTDIDPILSNRVKVTKIFNKIDLIDELPNLRVTNQGTELLLSVKSGAGMNLLYEHLKDSIGYNEQIEDVFIARRRHIDALNAADASIRKARSQLMEYCSLELVAEDLRQAQQSLSEITGAFTTDDLLAKIFEGFCVGK
ncbi:tRNA uridine-5-carboxymethylaminomethyl(34) synthesis GTPase MnmE [bacterium]|nr:tRNA uridine-5-carboxymethylaminomethyl(34) synthesis GTPase MnmE [bacterium]